MEHLLQEAALESYGDTIKPIPWYGFDHDRTRQYEVVSVEEYPILRGWTEEQVRQIKDRPLSDPSTIPMLQSMLSFGVWEAIMGVNVHSKDFLDVTPDGICFNTTKLRPVLSNLQQVIQAETDPQKLQSTVDYIEKPVKVAKSWSQALVRHCENTTIEKPMVDTLMRLVTLCGETADMIHRLFAEPYCNQWTYSPWLTSAGNETQYRLLLRENGWCPSLYGYLSGLSMSTVEYACLLLPPSAESSRAVHDHCDDHTCRANQVGLSGFRTRHAGDGCTCTWSGLSITEIRDTLAADMYFLVDASNFLQPDGTRRLSLVPFTEGMSYVAFSHVWAHGVGSDAEDGLPSCRIQRLLTMVQLTVDQLESNSQSLLFWIDSLCIPRDEKHKRKSIGMMASIYSNASAVIVLDSMLQKISYLHQPVESLTLYLLMSDWNRRLWTLQEALIATKVCVVFQDQVVDFGQLFAAAYVAVPTPVTFDCMTDIARMLTGSKKIASLARMIRHRATSNMSDEPLIMSTLLGLDTASIAQLDGEDRMCQVWLSLGTVSRSVLFTAEPKILRPGFRWAPSTFVFPEGGSGIPPYDPLDADILPGGLRAKFLVLDFPARQSLEYSTAVFYVFETPNYRFLLHRRTVSYDIVCDSIALKWDPKELEYTPAVALVREDDEGGEVPRYRYISRLAASLTFYISPYRGPITPAPKPCEKVVIIS
ncbi:hypothetical protein MMC30_006396 [Trapelia coarctata]|nr:hypothetical protein [Trapelia coarctata]